LIYVPRDRFSVLHLNEAKESESGYDNDENRDFPFQTLNQSQKNDVIAVNAA
jgi:hypothetical protein